MSNMNFKCDVCGREVYGCTFVNGMKFCAKCYQETFGDTEKDRKISDLQSQLVEKDRKISDLQSQLVEKDKEVFFYQNVIKEKPETATEMCELLRPFELKLRENEMYKDRFESLYNHYNQDKISFAVEQLEKVKEIMSKSNESDYIIRFASMNDREKFNETIDNQIKAIKEME